MQLKPAPFNSVMVLLSLICCLGVNADSLSGDRFTSQSHMIVSGKNETGSDRYQLFFEMGHPVQGNQMRGARYLAQVGLPLLENEAEPVSEPLASVDMDLSTIDYDSSGVSDRDIEADIAAKPGNIVLVAVVARNVSNLDTYQVEVHFDPESLMFTAGFEDNLQKGLKGYLKQNGGISLWMPATKVAPGVVNLSNALVGNNIALAPDGTGILGLMHFKVLQQSENNRISLHHARFIDSYGNCRQVETVSGGSLTGSDVIPGDLDGNGIITLADVVISLKVISGKINSRVELGADINNDLKIGIKEALFDMNMRAPSRQ
ncbi:hypothetical protein [Desulfobacter latus]|uniref:Cohesin domain-containing protein n=1 Tax=Desulfobacter latus TaxID=2292 RepID=A0A850SUL7_9BACT|nr:hypothetical protein [Desulfobacter latus]NWH04839.1 hypothetical protein [Desulfobacter latus]